MRTTFIVALVAMTSGQTEAVRLNAQVEGFGFGDGMNLFNNALQFTSQATGIEEIGAVGGGVTQTAMAAKDGNIGESLSAGVGMIGNVTPGTAGDAIGAAANPLGASAEGFATGNYGDGVSNAFGAAGGVTTYYDPTTGQQLTSSGQQFGTAVDAGISGQYDQMIGAGTAGATTFIPQEQAGAVAAGGVTTNNVMEPLVVNSQSSVQLGANPPPADPATASVVAKQAAQSASSKLEAAKLAAAQAQQELDAANLAAQQADAQIVAQQQAAALQAQQAQQALEAQQAQQALQAQQAQQALEAQQAQQLADQQAAALAAQQQLQGVQNVAQPLAVQNVQPLPVQNVQPVLPINSVQANTMDAVAASMMPSVPMGTQAEQQIVVAEPQNQQVQNVAQGALQNAGAHMPLVTPGNILPAAANPATMLSIIP